MGQQILNGVFVGSIYALSAFAALAMVEHGLSIWIALPLGVVAGGLIGIILERLAFRPLRGRSDSNISGLISSLAMAIVFEAIALQIFGPDISRFPQGTFPDRTILIGGAR